MNRSFKLPAQGIGWIVLLVALPLICSCALFPMCRASSGHMGFLPFFPFVFAGFSLLLHLVAAIWVAYDANRRGLSGILWGLLVFVTSVVGLIVYLLVAQNQGPRGVTSSTSAPAAGSAPTPADLRCPSCQQELKPDFKVCPKCGAQIACAGCGRSLQGDWNVCPYCGRQKG